MTVMTDLKQLYEIDDSLWLEETIFLLKTKQFNELDLDNLIEELEALGKSDFNKVKSLLRQIIIHLLLLQYWTKESERNQKHWRGEIQTFRFDLNNNLTTNFQNKLNQELESIYQNAVKFVKIKTDLKDFPIKCPYTLEQILEENYY